MSLFSHLPSWLRRSKNSSPRRGSPASVNNKLQLALEELETRTLMSASGLVAAYNFNEGSGNVLLDSSGNGNNGTLSNATWSNAGKYGGALSFTGTKNSFVRIADAASLDLTTGMTLEAWVDPTSLNSPDNNWVSAISKEHVNSSNDVSYALYAANGTNTPPGAHVLVGKTDYGAKGGSQLTLNQWTFLAATYDGKTIRMFINGTQVATKTVGGPIVVTADPLKIGGDWSGEMFTGLIDNVRIYNRALSLSEIQSDMATPVGSAAPLPLTASAGPSRSGAEGSSVTFSGSSSGGSGTLTYAWNFGDGTTATGTLTPSHTYANHGNYTATLTVTDGTGATQQSTTTAAISDVAPSVTITGGPFSGLSGTAVSFTATGSDPSPLDQASLTYSWNFGDGTSTTQQNPSHVYASAGTYTVTVTVKESAGLTGTATTTATVTTPTSSQPFPNNGNPPPLPAPTGSVVHVSTVSQLASAVANLKSGQTILIDPGTYNLTDTLYLPQGLTNVAIRGSTGNSADVSIWGQGMSGSILFGFWVRNVTNVTFADFTIGKVQDHCFILNEFVQSPLIHNVHMIDAGQQFVKANPDGTGGGVNNGVVEYSTIEYSTTAPGTYTNGIDVHTGQNWVIRNNLFRNIRAVGGLAGPAIPVWNGSKNFTVEANTFINNQREIAFGLSGTKTDDNTGGIIRNNFIYRSGGQLGDVAIGLWNSAGSEVANNTIWLNGDYVNAIEYRFAATTGVKILYNLTASRIVSRDGATGTVTGNITNAQASWFVNLSAGDLHLTPAATPAIDHAAVLTEVSKDYDGDTRPVGSLADVGADEDPLATPPPGDTTAPTVTAATPANGTTGVSTGSSVTVTFSEALDATTVNGSTIKLTDSSNNVVSATVSYNSTTHVATLTPTSPLAFSTLYVGVVLGGSTDPRVKDVAGNALAANFTWSFTTGAAPAAPAANAGSSVTGNEGSSVTFGGTVTGGSGTLTYSWAFGDGTSGSGSLTPSHVYANHGTYTATLTVTDSLNRTSQSSTTVTVNDVPPTVTLNGPYSTAPGTAINFSATVTDPSSQDTAGGFTYLWTFGDGSTSTQAAPSHAYATVGSYTVTLKVTEQSGVNTTASTTASVSSSTVAPVTLPFIVTPYLKIPNFGAQPTIVSVQSGNWSDPTIWSLGRLPGAGDIVDINPGTTVIYDVNSTVALNTLEIQPTASLKFRTDISTQVVVQNFLVLQDGYLEIGTQANPVAPNVSATVMFADQALNTTLDPEQYGNGLVVLGKFTAYGSAKTPFITLSQEPRAGDTILHLASPATGWKVGDKLQLPDTRQLRISERNDHYVPQWETLSIAAISADGLSVTLSAPLVYDHLGARDLQGQLDYLPQVADMTRNITVRSQSATGTRGYVMFTYRADVNVNYVSFGGLGRTKDGGTDNTTFNPTGGVSHLGTNEANRTPVTFLNLIGQTSPQPNGYQFTFVGNTISCPLNPMPFIWGINVVNSYYGLIQSNVLYNWNGAGVHVDSVSSYNRFDGNFVMRVTGTAVRLDQALQGDGYWFGNPNNYVSHNIATDINAAGGVYSYGFNVDANHVGVVKIPSFQGADPSVAGQSRQIDMNATPLLEFANNTAYGALPNGLTLWWLGTFYETPKGDAGVVKDFVVWHHHTWGYFGYETNNLVIDGFVTRGDPSILTNSNENVIGMWFADYMQRGLVIRNADIQGMATGIMTPLNFGHNLTASTMTIEASYLANVTNILIRPASSVNGSVGLAPMTFVIRDVSFSAPTNVNPSWVANIEMLYNPPSDGMGSPNRSVSQDVFVYNYNDVVGDNFQVFYTSAPDRTIRTGINGFVKAI